MRIVDVQGSRLRRLALVLALVAGIVGMHHMVAAGCTVVAASHASTHTQVENTAHMTHVGGAEVTSDSGQHSDAAASVEAAGALCLAVVVLWMFAVPLRQRLRNRSHDLTAEVPGEKFPPLPRPPDIHALSISRT